ncbi:MAG: NADH-ubiquinone oxidoreductase-F iron-sulfur binding region domain-containing protein [Candidatus Brocadiia bacterium]
MTYEEIRQKAQRIWEEFDSDDRPHILVGAGTCGRAAGAEELLEELERCLPGVAPDAQVDEVGCLGLCYAEPLVELRGPGMPRVLYADATVEELPSLLEAYYGAGDVNADRALAVMDGPATDGVPAFDELPMLAGQVRIVLRNAGRIDPSDIDHYVARDGYAGLAAALERTPEEVIQTVKDAGLRGRGGAGFPTGVKWGFCRDAPGETKYMICNADEGDPGAFMDRSVIESDPHSVIEGLAIGAYAIGASEGYVYARAEYPLAILRLRRAIAQAEECGLLGDDILGSGFDFHLKVKEGAGAFVCGEETALLASIEGRRGMPRPRPPFPAQKGLHGKPTNINNVETLANVPVILSKGADWFAQYGTEASRGTKTFALAGKINRTGLVEVPLGTPLEDIVFGIGGGIPDDKRLKAVQTGGPSGGCIPADMMDMPVDYEKLAQAGSIMGSGGMVVMDEDTCMVDIARYFIEFTHDESCGKCVPCRLGTRQMLNMLNDIRTGRGEIDPLVEIGEAVKLGALCGLGQTAPNPVLTTVRYFRDEYEAHIRDGRCPAGVCQELISFSIDPEVCICCGRCARECPADCISGEAGKPPAKATREDREQGKVGEPFRIDQKACIQCGTCLEVCPVGAVERE